MISTEMRNCNLRYANLGESQFDKWKVANCDLTDCFLNSCHLKEIVFRENRLVRTSFFKTPLRGLDFTSCDLEDVQVSEDGKELAGAKVDIYQAAEFAKLLGLKVV